MHGCAPPSAYARRAAPDSRSPRAQACESARPACKPYPPSIVEFSVTIDGATHIERAQYARATEYTQLQQAWNATCQVVASHWNGTAEECKAQIEDGTKDGMPKLRPGPCPTGHVQAVDTVLVLEEDMDYTLLLVGYFDRATYFPPDRGKTAKFGELYAVLLEDNAPPPLGHMGSMRMVLASPGTGPLTARLLDGHRQLTTFQSPRSDYVCSSPQTCNSHSGGGCRAVAVRRAEDIWGPTPAPDPGFCDPHNPHVRESCAGFNPRTKRAYSCTDPEVLNPCKESQPDWLPIKGPNARVDSHGEPIQIKGCSKCLCQYHTVNVSTGAPLVHGPEYCDINEPDGACPGKPTLHHASVLDPCPGNHPGEPSRTTGTCWIVEEEDEKDDYDCIQDCRPWSTACHLCPCPADGIADPHAQENACGPWANPTKASHNRPIDVSEDTPLPAPPPPVPFPSKSLEPG